MTSYDPGAVALEKLIAHIKTALAVCPDDRLVRVLKAAEAERSDEMAREAARVEREQVQAVRWRGQRGQGGYR